MGPHNVYARHVSPAMTGRPRTQVLQERGLAIETPAGFVPVRGRPQDHRTKNRSEGEGDDTRQNDRCGMATPNCR